ncbi:MAG: type IV toxin-antitoxin system AbiEi family antitoxin domain-containing protein [Chloroflexi bacterium]|nr:type IV toxin-antitoxin system AbiEi family antitoxin domain-containing protein [Chloroflexota bacterium]
MVTAPYAEDGRRPYGELAGLRLLDALEAAGLDPFTVVDAKAQGEALGLSASHTTSLLHRLSASGRLTRVKKGVYAVTDPVTRLPRAHPFAIGTALVTPSAISHWSAFQHWGLTEQIPDAVTLSSPTRTFPPSVESHDQGTRRAWVVASTRYEMTAITRERFFGVEDVWMNERDQVAIFDRERALLDAFQHFHIFGSLSVGLEALEEHLGEVDLDRLARYALQLGVTAVVKRLGWSLERQGAPEAVLAPLRSYPARGDAPLDPGRPSRGRHNSTWRVIENLRG